MASQTSNSQDETHVSALYHEMHTCWNRQAAHDFAALFLEDAYVIGFDGSSMDGRTEIEATLSKIFADHPTAAYVSKIRDIRFLAPDTALLRAVVGMVPPGKSDINPATNAVQTIIATKRDDLWRITLLQNTPAQFHGRPDLAEALTNELRQLL
jgi:uncharacterized protein (TIGR02246 family)